MEEDTKYPPLDFTYLWTIHLIQIQSNLNRPVIGNKIKPRPRWLTAKFTWD